MATLIARPADPSSSFALDAAADTFPKLLRRNAGTLGDRIAFREKELGVWRPITWSTYYRQAKAFGLGLRALGFQRQELLAIVGDNRPELFYAALGAQGVGGISYGMYQDSLAEQLTHLVDFSDTHYVFCEDQEQADKVLEMEARLPKVRRIIVEDWRGMWRYRHPKLTSFAEVLRLGRDLEASQPDLFDQLVSAGQSDDTAIFCQTSGTTALPKLAMLSHRHLLAQGLNFHSVEPRIGPRDEFVSYLPFAWIGEQMIAMTLHQLIAFTISFPEEPETVQRDFREISPHFTFAPARIYEALHTGVTVHMLDAGWLRQRVCTWALAVGGRVVDLRSQGARVPWGVRLQHAVAWFHSLGVNLKQIYGQTEIAGISCVHRDGLVHFWTMGFPIANTDLQITGEGEIISRSPSVFLGYYKNPEATAQALRGGWLYTGDYGTLDPTGDIIMFDRMSDVITLADGSKMSPWIIEAMLKFTPYIQEAMAVYAPDGGTLAAILNIDMRSVGKWAEDREIAYTSFADLSQKPEVLDLLHGIVRDVNRRLRPEWRVRRFVSLYKEFHPDDDELTRTRKLRRRFIAERYRSLIAAMCAGQTTFDAALLVHYEDGTTREVHTTLQIKDVETLER